MLLLLIDFWDGRDHSLRVDPHEIVSQSLEVGIVSFDLPLEWIGHYF